MGTGVFERLLIEDNTILKGLDNAEKNHKNVLDIFARRVSLYKDWFDKEHDPIIKAIIDAKKSVIMSDMGLLSSQYDIQSEIAKIISRIQVLEQKISRIQDRESS
jgi:hypothetical protein